MDEETAAPAAPDTPEPAAAPDTVPENESTWDSLKAIRAGREETGVDYGDEEAPEEAKEEEPEQETPADPAEEPETGDDDEPGAEVEPDARLQAALAALDDDDIEAALKHAFGDKLTAEKLKEKLGVHPARFKALREQRRKQEAELSQREQALQEQARKVVQTLEPAAKFHKAIKHYKQNGDPDYAVKAFEEVTGEEFSVFLRKFTAGEKSKPSPRTSSEIQELRQEIAELKKAREELGKPDPKEEYQRQVQAFHQQLETELSGSDVTKLPSWQAKVTAEMRRHYDPQLKGSRISPQKAAKIVVQRAIKEAEALGLSRAEAKAQVSGKKPVPKQTSRAAAEETGADTRDDTGSDALKEVLRMRRARRMKEAKR